MEQLIKTEARATQLRETRLRDIEQRIDVNLRSAYERIVEVGRLLLAAKNEKLVPHGQWEDWVRRVSGMSERQAQRWMQIAREVPENSYLSRLDVSKMRMILALPEPEREPVAKKAVEEALDVKELRAEIDRQRQRAERAEADAVNLREFAQNEDRRVKALEQKLNEAVEATSEKGISAEAAAKIDSLEKKLQDAQEYAQLQSEKRQKAQDELLEIKQSISSRPGGAGDGQLTSAELMAAVRSFVQTAGVMPHMGREFSRMGEREKRGWEQALEMMSTWAWAAQKALMTVESTVEA